MTPIDRPSTCSGHFHADEALAVHLLRTLPEYSSSSLIRTRDPALLDTCHTVVDVGGVYDASKNRYDHHQRDFETTFPAHSTKLSSAGLVYLHFGRAIIAHSTGLSVESEELELLYQKLYDDFIEAFDGNDNGIAVYGDDKLAAAGLKKRFNDRGFTLASVVNRLNFHYDSEAGKSREQLQQAEDERFLRASHFTGEQFLGMDIVFTLTHCVLLLDLSRILTD